MIIVNNNKQCFISASKENKTLFYKITHIRYFNLLYNIIIQKTTLKALI